MLICFDSAKFVPLTHQSDRTSINGKILIAVIRFFRVNSSYYIALAATPKFSTSILKDFTSGF